MIAAVSSALALGACGGDDEDPGAAGEPAQTLPTEAPREPVTTPPPETRTRPERRDPDAEPRTVPESELQGDEEEIRSEAVFTGRGGKLTPREIKVPAFIAIRVILRSGDGRGYSLEIGGQRLVVEGGAGTAEAKLDGLLPDERYEGTSPQGDVVVSATAEPGP